MADNSINIFPKKGESSEEFESFEIVGIVENIEKKKNLILYIAKVMVMMNVLFRLLLKIQS